MKSVVLFASILRIVFITAILGLAVYANAQSVAVNANGAEADASTMLEVSSTSKGFLLPGITASAQMRVEIVNVPITTQGKISISNIGNIFNTSNSGTFITASITNVSQQAAI